VNPIEEIISRLKRYPEADAVVSDDSVTINPSNENGFPVCFQLNGDEFQVGFDGWHEHFDDAEEALNCFVFGLSTACRLKVTLSGKRPNPRKKESGWMIVLSGCFLSRFGGRKQLFIGKTH